MLSRQGISKNKLVPILLDLVHYQHRGLVTASLRLLYMLHTQRAMYRSTLRYVLSCLVSCLSRMSV